MPDLEECPHCSLFHHPDLVASGRCPTREAREEIMRATDARAEAMNRDLLRELAETSAKAELPPLPDGITPEMNDRWRALIRPLVLEMHRLNWAEVVISKEGGQVTFRAQPCRAKETPNAPS